MLLMTYNVIISIGRTIWKKMPCITSFDRGRRDLGDTGRRDWYSSVNHKETPSCYFVMFLISVFIITSLGMIL
jgi:hypothetical protein